MIVIGTLFSLSSKVLELGKAALSTWLGLHARNIFVVVHGGDSCFRSEERRRESKVPDHVLYAYFLLPSHPVGLITATPTGTCDDDVPDDDRRTTPGAHTGPPRCRVEVRAPSPSSDWPFLITRAASPSVNDDRYEMRRECQEILPGLILGPLQAAKSLEILRGLGVTHVCVPRSPLQLAIGWLI